MYGFCEAFGYVNKVRLCTEATPSGLEIPFKPKSLKEAERLARAEAGEEEIDDSQANSKEHEPEEEGNDTENAANSKEHEPEDEGKEAATDAGLGANEGNETKTSAVSAETTAEATAVGGA